MLLSGADDDARLLSKYISHNKHGTESARPSHFLRLIMGMKGDLTWCKFRFSWIKVFKTLSNSEKDRLLDAIEAFTNDKEMPELLGKESVAWALIETELEFDKQSRQKAADAHRKAGTTGGRPKTNNNQTEPNETKNNQNGFLETNNNQIGTRVKEVKSTELRDSEVKSLEGVNCADAQKPSKPKPQKHEHGSFKNVLLTDAELEKLRERFSDADKRIESFSVKKAAKGYVYKSDYAAIIAWAGDDGKKQQQQAQAKKTYTAAEVAEMIDRGEL